MAPHGRACHTPRMTRRVLHRFAAPAASAALFVLAACAPAAAPADAGPARDAGPTLDDSCQNGRVLTLGEPVSGTLAPENGDGAQGACVRTAGGHDEVWYVDVERPAYLDITVQSATDTAIYVRRDACDAQSEILNSCRDDTVLGETARVPVLEPGRYAVIVDGADAAALGSYTLEVQVAPLRGCAPLDHEIPTVLNEDRHLGTANWDDELSVCVPGERSVRFDVTHPPARVTFTPEPWMENVRLVGPGLHMPIEAGADFVHEIGEAGAYEIAYDMSPPVVVRFFHVKVEQLGCGLGEFDDRFEGESARKAQEMMPVRACAGEVEEVWFEKPKRPYFTFEPPFVGDVLAELPGGGEMLFQGPVSRLAFDGPLPRFLHLRSAGNNDVTMHALPYAAEPVPWVCEEAPLLTTQTHQSFFARPVENTSCFGGLDGYVHLRMPAEGGTLGWAADEPVRRGTTVPSCAAPVATSCFIDHAGALYLEPGDAPHDIVLRTVAGADVEVFALPGRGVSEPLCAQANPVDIVAASEILADRFVPMPIDLVWHGAPEPTASVALSANGSRKVAVRLEPPAPFAMFSAHCWPNRRTCISASEPCTLTMHPGNDMYIVAPAAALEAGARVVLTDAAD